MSGCHYCGTANDLRPYGPGGAPVCFPCATASPEREEQAKAAFGALLEGAEAASPHGVAVIGQPGGPAPLLLSDAAEGPEPATKSEEHRAPSRAPVLGGDPCWGCIEPGCDAHPARKGSPPIFRLSPKGQPFVGACPEHYAKHDAPVGEAPDA